MPNHIILIGPRGTGMTLPRVEDPVFLSRFSLVYHPLEEEPQAAAALHPPEVTDETEENASSAPDDDDTDVLPPLMEEVD